MMPVMAAQMPKPTPHTSTTAKMIQLMVMTTVQLCLPRRLCKRAVSGLRTLCMSCPSQTSRSPWPPQDTRSH